MNANESDLPSASEPSPDAEAKPARKRAPRRTAASAAPADTAAAAAPVAAEPLPEATAEAKPARRPRKPRPQAGGDAPAEPTPAVAVVPEPAPAAASGEDAQPAPAPRTRKPRAAKAVEGAAVQGADASVNVPAAAPEASSGTLPEAAGEAAATVTPGGEDEGRGEGRGRNRRRRGRDRDRDRDRPAGVQAESGEPAIVVTVRADGRDDDEADPVSDAPRDAGDPDPVADAPRGAPQEAAVGLEDVLSGSFDAEAELEPGATADAPERRVLLPDVHAPKLQKVLAQAGLGSRRDMEQWIADGKVQVNGETAHTAQRISFGDRIAVDGKLIKVRIAPLPPKVLAYHKQVGEVVTHDDPQQRPTVFRRLPRLPQGKWQSVGRLDINTEGLLLFTNSGELAHQLMHPRFGVEREYAVRVLGQLDDESRQRLLDGVEIDGQRASFTSIEGAGGDGANRWYRVVIQEGRNREVRKLFDAVGLTVSRLIRIRYGCVVLPKGLKRGVAVALNAAEVGELQRLAAPQPRAQGQGPRQGKDRRDRPGQGQGQGPQGKGGGKFGKQGGGGGKQRQGGPQQGAGPRMERQDRADRADRQDRAERPPQERRERLPREEDYSRIPNPLMQTFDKRAIREARAPRRDIPEDGPIPNPLEQTYDKRFVQKGGGSPFARRGGKGGGGGGGGQPDPMKTAVGYIGADAFVRKFQDHGGGGGGRGGKRRR